MPRPSQYIGRQIRKRFGALGSFVGTVVSYRTSGRLLFLVLYEDDDKEELDQQELEQHLIPVNESANESSDKEPTRYEN